MKVDANGMVWFIESKDGNAVGRFNPFTHVYTEYPIPTPKANGYDLDIDASGDIWFTEFNQSKIGRLNPATGRISEYPIPTSNSQPFGIRVDSSGNVWFAEYGGAKIGEFTTSGTMVEYPIPNFNGNPAATEYLAPDSQGRIWFAESGSGGQISMLDPRTGVVTFYMCPTANNTPVGILVDGSGFVWFTEYGKNKIGRFNPSTGRFQEFPIPYAPGNPPNPWLLTLAPDGAIWFSGDQQFSNTGTGIAGRIDPNSGLFTIYTLPKPPMGGTPVNHPKGIAADQSGDIWVALWDTDYIAQLHFTPATAFGPFNSNISTGSSWTVQSSVGSSHSAAIGSTTTVVASSHTASTGTAWVSTISTSETITKTTKAWVSATVITVLPVSNGLSSGPSGDQSTTSTTFTPTAQAVTVAGGGSSSFMVVATSQLWDSSPSIGASIAVCRDGVRLSGDMYSVGATPSRRHLASAVSLDTPPAGSHVYSLCFKTNPGGTAFVSGVYIVVEAVSGGSSSGPDGDQSTTSTTFTPSAETLTFTSSGTQQYLLLATSQLWDSSSSVGASIAICKDGTRISGDMFSLGATPTNRHLAAATALDTPTTGSHTYSLCFKTDPGGSGYVSGTYLVNVPIQSAQVSGPHGDQSTTSTSFTPSLEIVTATTPTTQQYLILASSQVWDSSSAIGGSMAICRNGERISGDMYAGGALQTDRELALAVSLDSVNSGTYQYSLCFKTSLGY
jgi:virginiamycin B lyase